MEPTPVIDAELVSAKPSVTDSQKLAAALARQAQSERMAAQAGLRFVRALQVLLRAARFYQKNHPHLLESLEIADRALRETLELVCPLVIRFEHGDVVLGARQPGTVLPDSRGALKSLADEVSRRGIHSIVIEGTTNIGELHAFAALVHALSRTGVSLPADGEWPTLLERNHIAGIRVNASLHERKASAALASLIAAVLQLDLAAWKQTEDAPPKTAASSPEELCAVVSLLGKLAGALREKPLTPGRAALEEMLHTPQGTAAELKRLFNVADRNTVSITISELQSQAPLEAESLEEYLSRLAETMILEFAREWFRKERVEVGQLRALLEHFAREVAVTGELFPGALRSGIGTNAMRVLPGGLQWTEDAFAEYLYQRFWELMSARDKSEVLRGREAWCVPASSLRSHIDHLVSAGGEREARFALLNYAQCLERKETTARRIVAAGLSEFTTVVETLWPTILPEELSRSVLRAMAAETAPDVTAVLASIVEQYAKLALKKRDFAELERIVDALDAVPSSHMIAGTVRQRLMNEQHWTLLMNAALDNRPLDPVLPRILGRDPTRVLDHINALLSGPRGMEMLPAMARLIRAVGETIANALVTQLYDPRTPQALFAGAAVKLLAATRPERLIEAMPNALSSWEWNVQDLAVAELVRIRPQGLSRALLQSLERAHPLVVPMMIDEIGISKEADSVPLLMSIAAGGHAWLRDVYIRIKAVEALGRMRVAAAADVFRTILRRRDGLMHVEPAGLRAAAEDALAMLENRPSSARVRTHNEAAEKSSANFQRPRRYLRVPLESPLQARVIPTGSRAESSAGMPMRVATISLGGAFLESSKRLNVGDAYTVQIKAGLRNIVSTAVVRNVSGNGGGVEFIHMKQDDREKLRRLIHKLTKD